MRDLLRATGLWTWDASIHRQLYQMVSKLMPAFLLMEGNVEFFETLQRLLLLDTAETDADLAEAKLDRGVALEDCLVGCLGSLLVIWVGPHGLRRGFERGR